MNYVYLLISTGVLENLEDFTDAEELHDAIGGLLSESVGSDRDAEIR